MANLAKIKYMPLREIIGSFDIYSQKVQKTDLPYSAWKFKRYRNKIIDLFIDYIKILRKEEKNYAKKYTLSPQEVDEYFNQAEKNIITTFQRNVERAFGQAMHSIERDLGEQLSAPGAFGIAGLLRFLKKKPVLKEEKDKIEGFTRLNKKGNLYTIQIIPYLVMLIGVAQEEWGRRLNEVIAYNLGVDLAYVSPHPCWLGPKAKEVCNRWRDKIVSLSGITEGFPKLDDALKEKPPLFHPNCTHSLHTLTPVQEATAINRRIRTFSTLKKYI